jgi:hypothetical protein
VSLPLHAPDERLRFYHSDPNVQEAILHLLACVDAKISGTLEIDLKAGVPQRGRQVRITHYGRPTTLTRKP